MAIQPDGKIVAVGGSTLRTATSPSPATTPTARSTRASPATAGRRPTSGAPTGRTRWRSRPTARSSWSAPPATPAGDFALARYNPNGSLDTSFSGDGKQTTDFGGRSRRGDRRWRSRRRQDRRRRLHGGRLTASDFALARYNPNGSLDTSFSGDGKQTTDFGGHRRRGERGGAPGRRQDRRGRRHRGQPRGCDFALARYNPNGSLDTSFSGDGKQTTDFGGVDGANGVAIQGDGKIVAVGGGGRRRHDFALARYNPNGSLDTSFSGDGKQTTDFGGFDEANGVALQGDGKIVAVGAADGASDDFALARYNPNGSLDTTFSGDGKQTTDFGGFDEANAVALQARRQDRRGRRARSPATTSRSPATTPTARSTRASPGTASRRPTSRRRRGERGGAPGRRQDRRGRRHRGDDRPAPSTSPSPATTPTARSTRASPATAGRRPTSGSSRRRAGWRSRATARSSSVGAPAAASAQRRRCPTTSPSPATTRTARWTPASRVTASRRPTSTARHRRLDTTAVAIQGDGKIVVAAYSFTAPSTTSPSPATTRNGTLDTTFSGDGKQTTDFGAGDGRPGGAPERRQDRRGRLRCTATATSRSPATTPTARSTRPSPATASRRPTSGASDARERGGAPGDGKIVAVGCRGYRQRLRARPLQPERLARHDLLRRRQADDGLRGLRRRTGWRSRATAGSSRAAAAAASGDFALARYNPNGSLDTSFSGDGKQTTDFGGGGERANAVALQGDGNIVAAGNALGADGTRDFALARYQGGLRRPSRLAPGLRLPFSARSGTPATHDRRGAAR